MKSLLSLAVFTVAACTVFASEADAQVNAYISGPGVQTAETSGMMYSDGTTPGFLTETFSGPVQTITTVYHSATLNDDFTVGANDTVYPTISNGNYGGTNQGDYLSIGADTAHANTLQTISLKLSSPVAYIGFSFYAGDANNSFSIYNGNTLLGTYTTGTLINTLNTNPLKDVSGRTVNKSGYYGEPGANFNTSQPYAYIDLFGVAGTTFDTIVFGQNNSAAFETDNVSITTTGAAPAPAGNFIAIGEVQTPEPGTWVYLVAGVGAFAFLQRRRRMAGR